MIGVIHHQQYQIRKCEQSNNNNTPNLNLYDCLLCQNISCPWKRETSDFFHSYLFKMELFGAYLVLNFSTFENTTKMMVDGNVEAD